MNAISHEPAVLWIKGYELKCLHGVEGNTKPYPSDPCAKFLVTLMLYPLP